MKKCYLCNYTFNSQDVVAHGEHIIPNAIGGLLIDDGILCEACGEKLGSSVDNDLGKALRALCVSFNIRRDRDKHFTVPAEVTLKNSLMMEPPNRGFLVEQGRALLPRGPVVIRDQAAMVVYILGSSTKQVTNFAKSSIVTDLKASGYNLKFVSDPAQLVDRVILHVDCKSLALSRGLIKIAIGYARHHAIDRKFLQHLIVDDGNIICDEAQVIRTVSPYYPTGWCEGLYEAERYETDDFPPNHQLSLFSYGKRLFCYVDLFGVIQRYVLLSDAWTGPKIRERYVQKCPKWIYDETDGRPRRIQDLHMHATEFGIETDGRPWDDVAKDVRHAATTRPYELPSNDHLEKPGVMLRTLISVYKNPGLVHETLLIASRRADIAEKNFKCDAKINIINDDLEVLKFLMEWDPEDFRIMNEKGFCPDLSKKIDISRLAAYQDFRLCQFSQKFAAPWSIETK